jgi:putative mRNA 3-end processing factor
MPLIDFTDRGLYCAPGNFYIDPWRPVENAVITHAHSDHARAGSGNYLCHTFTKPLLEARLGTHRIEATEWGREYDRNGVKVSLHPAGHIIGSSQVRVEYKGEVWVVSGDYKLENDGLSGVFEPIQCNTFITESTFGLPIYRWERQQKIYADIQQWVMQNHKEGVNSVLLAYSLGKAQRILPCLVETGLPIFAHGAISAMHDALESAGFPLPPIHRITPETPKNLIQGNIIIAPPGADGSSWINRFHPYEVGVCSGWMQVRGNVRRRNADAGFALSDHADWDGLKAAVRSTGAAKVFVTHGFQSAFSRWLNENGIAAAEVKTEYSAAEEEAAVLPDETQTTNLNAER